MLSSTIQILNMHHMKCIGLTQHHSEALQKMTMPGFRYVQKIYGPIKIFCGPKAQFLLLGGGRVFFAIISFTFVNIRHHLCVILILGIFKILLAANDLLWSLGPFFYWEAGRVLLL